MKWSIFSRLMTGYLALLLIATAVSVYAIIQLRNMRDVTQAVILVDNPLQDLHKSLSDAFLSEQRYEKKYLITHDPVLFRSFLSAKDEFERHLHEAYRISDSADIKRVLNAAAARHNQYRMLVVAEARSVGAGSAYPAGWYRDEKEKALDGLSDELIRLRSHSQKRIFDKLKQLSEAGTRATRAAMATTASALAAGIAISLLITSSITRPLSTMKKKMAEISTGLREANLNITSPPEIAELARSFTSMCDRLKELETLKSDFYALMSHELRTPLASIRESTNLFLEGHGGNVTEKQKRLLSITAEESNRLIELVNSLLDISKMEAGMVEYHFGTGDLNALILKAVKEVTPLAEAKRIRIDKKLKKLPPLQVDNERILQALRNLIGNALKFTPSGGSITISSRALDERVQVSIADTGPGIPKEKASFIFDKYRQADVGGSRKLQGSGLGLAIVKHIVHNHGGSVWVESEKKPGSMFTFTLPVSSSCCAAVTRI